MSSHLTKSKTEARNLRKILWERILHRTNQQNIPNRGDMEYKDDHGHTGMTHQDSIDRLNPDKNESGLNVLPEKEFSDNHKDFEAPLKESCHQLKRQNINKYIFQKSMRTNLPNLIKQPQSLSDRTQLSQNFVQ